MGNKLLEIIKNENLWSVLGNFTKEYSKHPYLMSRESGKFLSHWLLGTEERKEGLLFENHSHSHFSEGDNAAELSSIVDFLFYKGIGVWSLTDHGNSNGFDSIASGKYQLNKEDEKKYSINVNPDRRSMIISDGYKNLILLRSMEYETDKGEIGIHGFSGKFPNTSGLPLTEAIKRGIGGGGYVVINHPYFWKSIGTNNAIEEAVNAGAVAIEKNGCEIPPQIYSPVRSELAAERLGIPLVTSGDAHTLEMYGKSGISFDIQTYLQTVWRNRNHADTVKALVTEGKFDTYLNYLTPKEFLGFFKF